MMVFLSDELWKEIKSGLDKAHRIVCACADYQKKGFTVADKVEAEMACGGFAVFIDSKMELERLSRNACKEIDAIKSV